MPNPRTTLILFALCLAAGGWLVFFELELQSTDERTLLEKRIVQLQPEEVERFRLRRDHWTAATVERSAQGFVRTEPSAGVVDQAKVERLLASLASADALTLLRGDADRPEQFRQYGLAQPALEWALALRDGKEVLLAFGQATATADGVYLHVRGSADVLVAPRELFEAVVALFDAILVDEVSEE